MRNIWNKILELMDDIGLFSDVLNSDNKLLIECKKKEHENKNIRHQEPYTKNKRNGWL